MVKRELQAAASKVVGLDVSAHARNFFDCNKMREPPVTNADVMRNSHVECHAAETSWMLKRKLTFNPVSQAFVDDDKANGLRSRPVRKWASS